MQKLSPFILVGGLPKAGKTSFNNRISKLLDKVSVFNEEDYVRQVNPRGRDYALDYTENAEFLLRTAMLKDVAHVMKTTHKPIIAESNFFVDAKYRKLYRDTCLDHRIYMPIYVSVYIPENIRAKNNVLDKYTEHDNEMFIGRNKRPRKTEGFVVMSVREVIEYLKERNGIT